MVSIGASVMQCPDTLASLAKIGKPVTEARASHLSSFHAAAGAMA